MLQLTEEEGRVEEKASEEKEPLIWMKEWGKQVTLKTKILKEGPK